MYISLYTYFALYMCCIYTYFPISYVILLYTSKHVYFAVYIFLYTPQYLVSRLILLYTSSSHGPRPYKTALDPYSLSSTEKSAALRGEHGFKFYLNYYNFAPER